MNDHRKVVLVTGAGQGIGHGCATILDRAGYEILANDVAHVPLMRLEREINCHWCSADAFTLEGVESIAALWVSFFPIWGVVSNPYKSIQKPFLEFSRSEFAEVLNAVFTSHCFVAQVAAKRMVEIGRGGRIIFIGSVYGSLLNRVNSAPYDSGKAALEEFARVLALELAPHRITVNCIAPGFTDTPGERRFASEEQIADISKKMPLGRACTPADIGHAAAFLMSEEAAMITGVTLPVTAGMHLKNPYGE